MTSLEKNHDVLYDSAVDSSCLKFIFDPRSERYRKGQAINPEVTYYQNLSLGLLSELIERYPEDKGSLCNRGVLLTSMGRIQEALLDFEKALALDSDFAVVYSNRASAFSMIDQTDKALIDFDAALAIEPRLETALLGRGGLFLGIGEFEKAANDLTVALEESPHLPEARMLRSEARFGLKKYEESAADVDIVLKQYPNFVCAHVQKGRLEAINGRYLAALGHLNKAIELDCRNARTYMIRSGVHKAFGNELESQNDLRAAFELDGTLGSVF